MQKWAVTSNSSFVNGAGAHLCLDAQNADPWTPGMSGDPLQLWPCTGGLNQQWSAESESDLSWILLINDWNQARGGTAMCLDALTEGTRTPDVDGDNVQLFTCNNHNNQQWSSSF
jgi:non-reducing end alpha-L-arabinofuranosidase